MKERCNCDWGSVTKFADGAARLSSEEALCFTIVLPPCDAQLATPDGVVLSPRSQGYQNDTTKKMFVRPPVSLTSERLCSFGPNSV